MAKYKLLKAFGIELEYMVVDNLSLDIRPIVDTIIQDVTGEITQEVERPRVNWSNELSLHVVELKNKNPEISIADLLTSFQSEISGLSQALKKHNCILLPGAVHPWMNPMTEAKLWPHSNKVIYNTYDRIFGCKGHGWSNLQSMHINIAFDGDEEFAKLHSAIRIILPLIPAICSSSPIIDGQKSEYLSARLNHYLKNQRKIPSIIGQVIPEAVTSKQEYQEVILNKMYKDISKFDQDKVLQYEWLNSRGAIAKFKYGCIEIRLADVQECPMADLATAHFFTDLIKAIALEGLIDIHAANQISESELKEVLVACAKDADQAVIQLPSYLKLFGLNQPIPASELLKSLYKKLHFQAADSHYQNAVCNNLDNGPLSRRILKSVSGNYDKTNLVKIYSKLSECLMKGQLFEA